MTRPIDSGPDPLITRKAARERHALERRLERRRAAFDQTHAAIKTTLGVVARVMGGVPGAGDSQQLHLDMAGRFSLYWITFQHARQIPGMRRALRGNRLDTPGRSKAADALFRALGGDRHTTDLRSIDRYLMPFNGAFAVPCHEMSSHERLAAAHALFETHSDHRDAILEALAAGTMSC